MTKKNNRGSHYILNRLRSLITGAVMTVAVTLLAALILAYGSDKGSLMHAEAAGKKETVDIRIIGTTDLHGQLNSKDYEQGVDYNFGGLARVIDLIKKIRAEVPDENSVTLDAGDTLFDYTTEYIFSESQEAVQPIYQAMAMVGYDAITLGNHDFDYGYDYILRQLYGSGLKGITVVSNVQDSKTGDYPFLENMLITRNVKTSLGNETEVKIGIVGQTIPTLTSKTHSYAGILKTQDMVANAREQARKLKDMGADIIIALSHTGIGPENPELNFKNVAYALTKIPEIDVVVCGHEHNLFPTEDMTSPYYKLPNVDKETYLMNGKNVVMAGSRGEAVGVVDLTLEMAGDEFIITNRHSELRKVTPGSTVEDKLLASFYGQWEEELLNYSTDVIGKLEENEVIQNYYGLLGDNRAIQVLNDSKIQYALNYIHTSGSKYKNYPVIAASSYISFGARSINDYISIRDEITESDLSVLQPYNNYLYIYTITGKQLREWLEWSASAYESYYFNSEWEDEAISRLMAKHKIKYLVREEWMKDWSSFYIFDGIDYIINPIAQPRYDISGNRINDTSRIQSITHNGVEVSDDMEFLLVTDKITKPVDANQGIEKQVVLNGFTRSQSVLGKYIEQLSKNGEIIIPVDNNWRVTFPEGYQFMIRAPYYADQLIRKTRWFRSFLAKEGEYGYYLAQYPVENGDDRPPKIVAAPLVTHATSKQFNVAVQVADSSMLKEIWIIDGIINADYTGWNTARQILNGSFTVWENGIYSIYAEDVLGNKSVIRITIDNFDPNLLSKPQVDTYTNRKTKISGTAEPGTTIVFEAYTGTYESKVDITGKFSYPLPAQPSDTLIDVYIKDEIKGLKSEHNTIRVKRTGPNQPSVNPVYNNAGFINGSTNDSDAIIIAVIDDKVYVPENDGRKLYEANTEIYDKKLKIVETYAFVSNNYFLMAIPPQEAGKAITVYNIDHMSRNSRSMVVTTEEVAPNAPVVYEVCNIEKSLSGYVPGTNGRIYDIMLTIGNKTYTAKSDKNGKFSFRFNDQLHAGQILTVTASDTLNGAVRKSYAVQTVVKDIESLIRIGSDNLTLNRVTSRTSIISGNYQDGGEVYLAIASGRGEEFTNSLYLLKTDERNRFKLTLESKLEPGTYIYVMTRFTDGRILQANLGIVLPGRPDMPKLVREITNTDKLVEVLAEKDCEITLKIGSKKYTATEYRYDDTTGNYIYSLTIDRDVSGIAVTVTAANVSGVSDAYKTELVKAAPDAPAVNPVKAGDRTVTGTIELYETPVQFISDSIKTEEKRESEDKNELKDSNKKDNTVTDTPSAASLAEQRGVRIYAQVDSKTYEGIIYDNGYFSIKVPALSEGTTIKVWGTNRAGRGPLTKVKAAPEQQ